MNACTKTNIIDSVDVPLPISNAIITKISSPNKSIDHSNCFQSHGITPITNDSNIGVQVTQISKMGEHTRVMSNDINSEFFHKYKDIISDLQSNHYSAKSLEIREHFL